MISHDPMAMARALLTRQPLLAKKIAKSLLCRIDEAEMALVEVVKFLLLVAQSEGVSLTPSQRVDLAWHEFLLFTRLYEEFCNVHFGRFLHHDPGGSSGELRDQYHFTLQRYRAHFQEPDERFWSLPSSNVASCGSCESLLEMEEHV